MALVTLSGVIDKDDLNNNFSDRLVQIETGLKADKKTFENEIEIFDISNASTVATTILDFTAPDDLEVLVFGLHLNSANSGPVITATITAIDIEGTSVPLYLNDQTISVNATAIVGESQATRFNRIASTTSKIFLKRGVTYRITVTSNSATVVAYCKAMLVCKIRRRSNAT